MNRFVIKHFFRQKICLILGLLLYAVGWGFLLFLAGKGFSGFMLLHTLARGCFYICFGWVCLTFYFISSPNCIPQTPTDGFAEQNGRDAERAD